MKLKLYVLCSLATLTLVGCNSVSYDGQPHVYSGKGQLQDLLAARQQCLAESSGSGGGVNVNVTVNSNSSAPSLSCAGFNTCVATKGYMRDPTGNISLPDSYVMPCSD